MKIGEDIYAIGYENFDGIYYNNIIINSKQEYTMNYRYSVSVLFDIEPATQEEFFIASLMGYYDCSVCE